MDHAWLKGMDWTRLEKKHLVAPWRPDYDDGERSDSGENDDSGCGQTVPALPSPTTARASTCWLSEKERDNYSGGDEDGEEQEEEHVTV